MADVLQLAGLRPAFVLSEHYPPMLTFEQPDGSSLSLRYSDLRSIRYLPEETVLLRFARTKVEVHGRNLLPVWTALRSRRAKLLRAETESDGITRAAFEPHISRILLTPAERE